MVKEILKISPQLKRIIDQRDLFKKYVPPGHYYSPIPSIDEILADKEKIWGEPPTHISGIDLNTDEQLELLDKFDEYYKEIPFRDEKTEGLDYFFHNEWFSYSDAVFLYCMIRHLKPVNIIEIGSGYSSCVTLDTNRLFFDNKINCHFIEPYPERLNSLVKGCEKLNVYNQRLQDIPIELFLQLQSNDILFIDSTHVSKIHSDVNTIIHDILPLLKKNVVIHFHDVFYPFEYPEKWVLSEYRTWNEQYMLRAFLEYNACFRIILFTNFLETMYRNEIESRFPLIFKATGASLWIKKVSERYENCF